MKFKITTKINDGKLEARPFEVEVGEHDPIGKLLDIVYDEMFNDVNRVVGTGFTLTLERTE